MSTESELKAASAALAREREPIDRAINLSVAIKLAQQVRDVGNLPANAPQCLGALVALLGEVERQRIAVREIKETCLVTTDGAAGLAHIVRLCIDAGCADKLPDLERDNVRDLFRELEVEGAITRPPVGRDPAADALAPKTAYPDRDRIRPTVPPFGWTPTP